MTKILIEKRRDGREVWSEFPTPTKAMQETYGTRFGEAVKRLLGRAADARSGGYLDDEYIDILVKDYMRDHRDALKEALGGVTVRMVSPRQTGANRKAKQR